MNCSKPNRRRPTRPGLTLIEIVAAITLAATLLVGVLSAYGGAVRQSRAAQRRLEALGVIDELMREWFRPGGTVPLPAGQTTASGEIPEHPHWNWRLQRAADSAVRSTGPLEICTVSVWRLAGGDEPEHELASLEFVGPNLRGSVPAAQELAQ